jgi:hypothetical protein
MLLRSQKSPPVQDDCTRRSIGSAAALVHDYLHLPCLTVLLLALVSSTYAAPVQRKERICKPPSAKLAWHSAVKDGGLLSISWYQARYESRYAEHAGRGGHWVHLSDTGPANGVLAWWPCGARSTSWLTTGRFGSWRTGPAVPGQSSPSLWLQTERFGTGSQTITAQLVLPQTPRPYLAWEAEIYETFSGPDEIEIERSLRTKDSYRWALIEKRVINGTGVAVEPIALCWRKVSNAALPRLVACRD